MKDDLKQLYNKLILVRQKDTTGFEKRENAQFVLEAFNPVCGDQYKLYLDLEGNRITKASYHGYGCALSKAATSLLVEGLTGKSVNGCLEFIEDYLSSLEGDPNDAPEIYKALAMAKNFPGRKQCAVLSWEAVFKFITDMIGNQTNIDFRYCQQEDLSRIYELLNDNSLPVADLDIDKVKITVATINRTIAGCIGIEEYGSDGLLRSFAVLKQHRDKGIGDKLFRNLLAYCAQTEISTLHLLTDTAEGYFSRKGFVLADRDQAPPGIKGTSEFTELCPATCAYMVLGL